MAMSRIGLVLLLLFPWLALAAPRIEDGGGNGRKIYQRSAMACLVSNDFYIVHFSAYQETPSTDRRGNSGPFAKHCQDVPNLGKTYLTADLLDRDVRSTPIALRVVEEELTPGQAPKVLRTVAETPAKVYPTGVVEIHANMTQAGHYALLLDVGEGVLSEDDHLRVPFNVGLPAAASNFNTGLWSLAGVATLLAAGYLYWIVRRRRNGEVIAEPGPAV